jgi:hypothetical protein
MFFFFFFFFLLTVACGGGLGARPFRCRGGGGGCCICDALLKFCVICPGGLGAGGDTERPADSSDRAGELLRPPKLSPLTLPSFVPPWKKMCRATQRYCISNVTIVVMAGNIRNRKR